MVPGTWYLLSGIWYLVSCIWYLASGQWYLASGTLYLVSGTWYLVHWYGIWYLLPGERHVLDATAWLHHIAGPAAQLGQALERAGLAEWQCPWCPGGHGRILPEVGRHAHRHVSLSGLVESHFGSPPRPLVMAIELPAGTASPALRAGPSRRHSRRWRTSSRPQPCQQVGHGRRPGHGAGFRLGCQRGHSGRQPPGRPKSRAVRA